MNTRTTTAALIAALALTLTGCAGNANETPADSKPSQTAPLVAETEAPASENNDEAFLTYVRENLPGSTTIPNASDEQLVEAGHAACAQIEDGVPLEDVTVIDGETRPEAGKYKDSAVILNGGLLAYCPELAG